MINYHIDIIVVVMVMKMLGDGYQAQIALIRNIRFVNFIHYFYLLNLIGRKQLSSDAAAIANDGYHCHY